MHELACQNLSCNVLDCYNTACPMRAGVGKLACGCLAAAAGGRGHTRRHEHAPAGLISVPYPGEKLDDDSMPTS